MSEATNKIEGLEILQRSDVQPGRPLFPDVSFTTDPFTTEMRRVDFEALMKENGLELIKPALLIGAFYKLPSGSFRYTIRIFEIEIANLQGRAFKGHGFNGKVSAFELSKLNFRESIVGSRVS
jgi:hypothetical protein